ncbi:ABC transporter permease [Streptomyces sp. B8F3]|uniref:ABC transporter permease n=1 Tax=Streptomyces sp. B8F3 TaxID=3153573 RepID=UPI00325D7697
MALAQDDVKKPAGSRPGGGPARRAVRTWIRRAWPSLAVFVAGFVLWELAVEVFGISNFELAKPSEFLAEMWRSRDMLGDAAWVTTQEILYGFLLSFAIGVLLAVFIVRFGWLERALYPLIVLFQVVPKVALAPIFILWFGYGLAPKLLLIVVITFFPITLNMIVGLKAIDQDLLLLMRSVGSSRNQILTRIQIPTSLPYLFAGMRIAITLAVIGAVVAEFSGAQNGLGYLIQFASTQLDTPLMFAALTLVSLLGLILYYGMSLLEFVLRKRFPHITADTTR